MPATRGRYVFGDFCRGDVLLSRLDRPSPTARATRVHVEELVSFGEDARARLYVVSRKGPVYRIVRRR